MQVLKDLLDDRRVFDEGHCRLLLLHNRHTVLPVHNSYYFTAMGAQHRVDFIDLLDQARPGRFGRTDEIRIGRRFE